MAKSLVKKGLQLVKSGFTEKEEDHSREKADVSVKSRGPKFAEGSSSERGVHVPERRPNLEGTSRGYIHYSSARH